MGLLTGTNVMRSDRYQHLDEVHEKLQQAQLESIDFDEFLQTKIDNFLYGDKDFIYKNDISKVWDDYLKGVEAFESTDK